MQNWLYTYTKKELQKVQSNKLNLNIARYAIGATIPGDLSCGSFRPGADIESFQDGLDKPFLEYRNSNARNILLAAKKAGADTFEAFSLSPPSWMTRSNCSKGNPNGAPLHDNFDSKYARTFANYITDVIKFYHDKHNLSFTYVCLFYEPSSGTWTGPTKDSEGCNMEKSTIVEVIISTYAALQAKQLIFCSIAVASEKFTDAKFATQKYLVESGKNKFYSKISFTGSEFHRGHPRPAELSTLAFKSGTKLEQNNYGGQGVAYLPSMQTGLDLATQIIGDIQYLAVSSWGIWEAVPKMLTINYANPAIENIRYTARYYSLMQFSKYIRKGYKIIHISDCDQKCLAAYSSEENILVMVFIITGLPTVNVSVDLSGFSSLGQVLVYRTSPYERHVCILPPPILENSLTGGLLGQSVTTVQILNATLNRRFNLLKNGDFETTAQIPVAWFLLHGERSDDGVNGNYVYRDNLSGYLDFNTSKLTLMQNVTASISKIHHLSAWCSATGPDVRFGALVNDNVMHPLPFNIC